MGLFRVTKVLVALEDRKVETLTVETFAEQAEISIELNVSSSMQRSAWQFHCQPVARRCETGFGVHTPQAPEGVGTIMLRDKSMHLFFGHVRSGPSGLGGRQNRRHQRLASSIAASL